MAESAAPRRNRILLEQWTDLFEHDSFRRFWLMRLAGVGAINALTYTLLVLTVRQSTSALATGLLLLTIVVPSAVFGAIAGVAVDRFPRGLVLFSSYILRAALVVVLVAGMDSLPVIYAVSLLLGVIAQFSVPAEGAVLPQIVRPERLTAAHSFLSLGTLGAQAAGMMIIAPVLLKTTDGAPLLFLLAALFVVAAVLVTVIPQFHFSEPHEGGQGRLTLLTVRRQFSESWIALARDSTAYLALVLSVVAMTSMLVVATLLPKFSTQVVSIEPENIVFVLAPAIVGIFMGLRCVELLAARFNKLGTISGAYLLMAASLTALGLVPAVAGFWQELNLFGLSDPGPMTDQAARILATVIFANCYGFALTVVLTMARVLLNERVPQQMQGRIFAAQAVLSNLFAIVPLIAAGVLADLLGVAPVLVAAGVVSLGAAAWSRARSNEVATARGPA